MKQDNRLLPTEDELPEWAASDLPWRARRFSAETPRNEAQEQV